MRCPACERENPADARFCTGCGGSLALVCPSCRTANTTDSRFCKACGAVLGPPVDAPTTPSVPDHLAGRILAERGRLEGERKQVTVLFADVAGSTELIRDLDAEDAQTLLDGALGAMIGAAHRYEGTVAQTRGTGCWPCSGRRWPRRTTARFRRSSGAPPCAESETQADCGIT